MNRIIHLIYFVNRKCNLFKVSSNAINSAWFLIHWWGWVWQWVTCLIRIYSIGFESNSKMRYANQDKCLGLQFLNNQKVGLELEGPYQVRSSKFMTFCTTCGLVIWTQAGITSFRPEVFDTDWVWGWKLYNFKST